jgi:hypothetical protein
MAMVLVIMLVVVVMVVVVGIVQGRSRVARTQVVVIHML